jgi:hypothetical protein
MNKNKIRNLIKNFFFNKEMKKTVTFIVNRLDGSQMTEVVNAKIDFSGNAEGDYIMIHSSLLDIGTGEISNLFKIERIVTIFFRGGKTYTVALKELTLEDTNYSFIDNIFIEHKFCNN